MAELIAHTPQHAFLETSGYIGEPTGEIILTENHRTYNVKEYAEATTNIPDPILIDKKFEANGTYPAQDYEADGFSEVEVDVQPFLMTKNISKNGDYKASEDGVQGYDEVKVNLPFEQKTVTPSTTQQTVTPSQGFEAISQVTVEPTPLESATVTPTTSQQTIIPETPNIGFSNVTVEGVTAQIDPDIQPENIKQGVDILGVEGTLKPPVLTTKQITENGIYSAEDDNADGYSEVEVDVPAPILHLNSITVYHTPDTEMNMAGIKGLTRIILANNPNLERIINLDASGLSSLDTCFTNSNHLMLLDWTPPQHITYMGRAFENCNAIIEINLAGTTFSASNWGAAFGWCFALVTIYGELDFTSCTNAGETFYPCAVLENVSFKANTIPISLSFGSSPLLSNVSIVSIANGLSESVSGQTLTLHADVKNKLLTIFGTVALDDTQSYHVFTADSGGTVTLSEFITNTKGWSIA